MLGLVVTVPSAGHAFAGLRLLVVEDEALVAMLIEDALLDLGCLVVGPAGTVRTALALAEAADSLLDGALLDVNLGGDKVYPVAAALTRRGVPFVFISGYGSAGLEEPYTGAPVINKPFRADELARGIATGILGRRAKA